MQNLPDLKFSQWYQWTDRNQFLLVGSPGVYLISITTKIDLAGQQPDFADVVYIGMTNSQGGLSSRWNQFQRAISGNGKHSGGKRIYLDRGHYNNWVNENLYVAAFAVECNVINPTDQDYVKMGYVAYLEYLAFAQYYQSVGGHPKFNTR